MCELCVCVCVCVHPTLTSHGDCVLCHLYKPIVCAAVKVCPVFVTVEDKCLCHALFPSLPSYVPSPNLCFLTVAVLCLCLHRWSWCRWTRGKHSPSGQRTAHCNASRVSPIIHYSKIILMCGLVSLWDQVFSITLIIRWLCMLSSWLWGPTQRILYWLCCDTGDRSDSWK